MSNLYIFSHLYISFLNYIFLFSNLSISSSLTVMRFQNIYLSYLLYIFINVYIDDDLIFISNRSIYHHHRLSFSIYFLSLLSFSNNVIYFFLNLDSTMNKNFCDIFCVFFLLLYLLFYR